jgi:phenylalanyl-tRNA synthetase alpha chain
VFRRVICASTTSCTRTSGHILPLRSVLSEPLTSFLLIRVCQSSDPATSLPPPPAYYSRVSQIHEHGGHGSAGYRAPWSHDESKKLLLRTHTTSSSAQMLYKLAKRCRGEADEGELEGEKKEVGHGSVVADGKHDDGFRPAKLFSIDRVFRNETMDATHLAEFHQVEGVVADRNLTLADLIGERSFQVCMAPALMSLIIQVSCVSSSRKWESRPSGSNPHTIHTPRFVALQSKHPLVCLAEDEMLFQPSLEIFAFHPMLNRWVEVGNSGMFRPEMLEPMGLPRDVRVHGWGLSLERPTMIR